MSFSKFAGLITAVMLLASGHAIADAPVEVSAEQAAALDTGARVRVIVMMSDPGIPVDAAAVSPSARAERSAAIRATQDAAVNDALGLSLEALEERRDRAITAFAEDRAEGELREAPRLVQSYRHTPALAMSLNRAEIEAMARAPGVERIVEDLITEAMMDESLPLIGATLMHDLGFTGEGYAVAIVDTGTDHDHPMLANGIVSSACFSTTDPTINAVSRCPGGLSVEIGGRAGDDCDRCRIPATHGTHVGGTAAGRPVTTDFDGTNRQLMGVAPGAGIVAVNVFYTDTQENDAYSQTSDQLAALEWLFDNREIPNPEGGDPIQLAAINMSLGGGYTENFCPTNPLTPIISMLRTAGVATVIASGNESRNYGLAEPACIEQAITVGATDRDDRVASFSNSFFVVDLLAPGVGIRSSTDMEGTTPLYDAYNGTSMATPHVAGAIALLRSAVPNASLDEIELALKATGRPITDTDNNLTRPRIQLNAAYAALVELTQGMGPLAVSPTTDYYATVDLNRPEQPDAVIYTIRNTGAADMNVTVTANNNDAITFGGGLRRFTTTVAAGGSIDFGVEVDPAAVTLGRTNGEIEISAPWQGGRQVLTITATTIGYTGAPPTQRPLNDNFANAFPITDAVASFPASTYGATTQIGEPDHADQDNGGSIWYVMEAERGGTIRFTAQGRLGQTSIGVYRGDSLVALQSVASASNTGGDASVDIPANEGDRFRIAVDYNPVPNTAGEGERDPITISVLPQAASYDAFASALELTGDSGLEQMSFAGSTVEAGEPFPPMQDGRGTLWMHVAGPAGSQFSLSVVQATEGVVFELFSGNSLASLTEVEGWVYTSLTFGTVNSVTIPDGGLYIRAVPLSFGSPVPNNAEFVFNWAVSSEANPARVATAVAPQIRTVQPNRFVSALVAASAAASGADGSECGVLAPLGYPGVFRFMPLTPETGGSGDAVDIPAGQSQIFAFGAQRGPNTTTPNAFSGLTLTPVTVSCENGSAARQTSLNTLYLTVSETPLLDVITSMTPASGNAAEVPLNGVTRVAAAAVNIGSVEGDVLVVPIALADSFSGALSAGASEAFFNIIAGAEPFPALPLGLSICPTDPSTGVCYSDFAPHLSINGLNASESRTFAVRLEGQGEEIAFSPAQNRIGLIFIQVTRSEGQIVFDSARLVGGTTIAVRTAAQN
ncbi:MAG: S8 family serine peptidase [Alphaproteobacteria bacterium]|nr:S8 family serine peptidase [Alphaproteobacteria bacterium]